MMRGQPLSSKLSDYDLFAIQPGLRIKGRDQMASVFGLVLTFLTVFSLFGLTIYLVVRMLNRDNPNVTMSEMVTNVYNGDSVTIAMDNHSFYFGFGLFTEDVVSDPEILDIRISGDNLTYVPPDQIVSNNFSMDAVLCDWYDEHGQWQNQGFCIDKDFTLLSGMQGPDHAANQSLTISFSPCSQKTGSPVCKDKEKIAEMFSESEFRVTYTNPSINHNNHNQPITINYINYEEYILPGYTKTLYFFITKVKIITDSGWLFESTKEEDAVLVEGQRTTIQPRYEDGSNLFNLVITANDKVIIYNRSYTKIQDVFAEITGLASFVVLILAIFARPFFQFKMTEALVNNVYDVLIKEDAIGIIEHSSNNDNNDDNHDQHDKKDREGRERNLKRSSSLRDFIQKRKSSKIAIEEPTKKTIINTYETQTTLKSEPDDIKRQGQPQPDGGKDLEVTLPEPLQISIKNNKLSTKEKENGQVEIELGTTRKNKPRPTRARTLPPLEPITKTISVYETQTTLNKEEPPQTSGANSEPTPKEENNELIEIDIEAGEHNLENNIIAGPALVATTSLGPRYKLDVSFGEWLLSFFRPQLQVRILNEAEEMLSRNLDIVTIIKNIAEINKLKECLLNDQQRILFDHLPSSFILLDPMTRMKSTVVNSHGRQSSSTGTEEERLKEAYNGLKESQNKSALDSKILSLYEKKCLNFSVRNKEEG